MKRTRLIVILIATAACASAQTNRDAYRLPYKTWRETSPELERDAGNPTPEFPARVEASAKAAQDYFNARAGYVNTSLDQVRWAQTALAKPGSVIDTRPEVQRLLSVASEYLTKTIGTFSGVKDPAIQQVRQAMERERAALNSLTASINARKTALITVTESTEDADALRAGAAQSLMLSATGRARLADQLRKEGTQWSTYYRDIVDGAMARSVTTAAPTPSGGAPVIAATNAPTPATPAKPTPTQRTAGQFPLARYTGEWMFPPRGLYYGAQPESIELIVNEKDGRLVGTLSARFILSPGNSSDPVLRFNFDGPIQNGRSQSLAVTTEAGAKGTIELIPGAAFNLLEVTFETEPSINKIRSGNFVLLKR
jgi:hypothetical protein